jgi:hypothetical protein
MGAPSELGSWGADVETRTVVACMSDEVFQITVALLLLLYCDDQPRT